MRTKNSTINLIFYLLYQILLFACGFIFPRFIILYYGSEINGLTSTINRILSLIMLIQSGAIGAAIFHMYRPVAENDYETQSAILYSSKKFYIKIMLVFSIVSILISVVFSLVSKSDTLSFWEIFSAFLILITNNAFSISFVAICDIYFSSHQKKYYIVIANLANLIINYSLLSLVIYFHLYFIYIYICILCGGIVGVLINYYFYRKYTKNKISKYPDNRNYKITGKNYLMFSTIGSETVTLSPSIIVSMFKGLVLSSVFSVYSIVFTSVKVFITSLGFSLGPIFGNLVKTSNDEHISLIYGCIELLTIVIGCVFSVGIGFLIIPFIKIYTSNVVDVNYIYPILGIFITFYTMIISFRSSFEFLSKTYGFFKQTCYPVLIFAVISIIISIICTIIFGMPYVMIGLLFNQLCVSIALIIIIKKNIKWFSLICLIRRFIFLLIMTILSVVLYFVIEPNISSILMWIFYGVIVVAIAVLVIVLYCFIFERKYVLVFINKLKIKFVK